MSQFEDPISAVTWVSREELVPNDYNPNVQLKRDKANLIQSILNTGWTQPIVAFEDTKEIIDGFHRYSVSGDKKLMKKYKGMVPVVYVKGASRKDRMIATVNHNRARGTHNPKLMQELVIKMRDEGLTPEEIMTNMKMPKEEYIRLSNNLSVAQKVVNEGHVDFSKAWVPQPSPNNILTPSKK